MNCRAMPETFQRRIGPLMPGRDLRQAHTGLQHRREAVAHVCEIFLEMLDDVAAAMQRREHIDKTKHLHLEMFVPHRERHHALVEAGLAENRFGISIDQLKNPLAALLGFKLAENSLAR